MNYFSIDFLIVYTFLAITLVIGIRAGKGVKDIRDYVIANKSFGTGALVLTYLATNITGAGVLHVADLIFSKGIIIVVAGLGVMISYIITAFFIAPKIIRFSNCLTMGDLMKELYGPLSGIIAGILGFLTTISIAGMDLIGISIICETLLGIKASWVIIIIALLLAIYSARGGIRSVTATDIFQFLVFIIGLPTIAYFILNKAGGIQAVFTNISIDQLQIISHENFSFYLILFLLWSIFPAGMIDPAIMQRLLTGKNGRQLRNQYLVIAGFEPAFYLILLCIAFSTLILYPNLEKQHILPHIIQNLLPIWLKGIAIASLLATSISSVSSYLHIAGVTFVHDIIQPLIKKRYAINELRWMRYTTLGMSLIAVAISLKTTNTFDLLLTTLAFTGPLLMFPLLSGIMGLKTDKQSFYVALIITLIAFTGCKFFLPDNLSYLTTLVTIISNGIFFFGMHLYVNKGFAIVSRKRDKNVIWQPNKQSIYQTLKTFIPTPKGIVRYSQEKTHIYGAPYILFGVFFAINYIVPYFIWPTEILPYNDFIVFLRMLGGVLCGLLIVREKWANWLVPYIPSFWHFTVMYCLPFTGTIMLLFTGASIEWVVHIIAIIILLFLLLDWVTAIIIGVLGVVLGYVTYRLFFGIPVISISFISRYLMIYQAIFGILIGFLFARRRQMRYDRLTTDNQSLVASEQENKQELLEVFKDKIRVLKTLKHAKIENLRKAVTLVKELRLQENQGFQEVTNMHNTLDELQATLTPMAVALERIESRANDYLRLDIQPIAITNLLVDLQEKASYPNLSFTNNSSYTEIIGDPKRIEKLLLNSVEILAASMLDNNPMYISLADTKLTYALTTVKKDNSYIKQVPAIAFSLSVNPLVDTVVVSYEAQMQSISLPIPNSPEELLPINNQRIIKAHYGYTNIVGSKQINHLYVLPTNLKEVRPRDMDDPYMELGVDLIRADDTYPGAIEQERAFLQALQKKSNVSLTAIETAIEMIKWYHGPVKRKSGEPFYLHPIAVAQIVLNYNTEKPTIIGALLHDTVEDTAMLLENIEMIFGKEVADVVDGVTHFESRKDTFYKVQLTNHENILMLLETADKRALYVKIADRMHNMRTIEGHSSYQKKKSIAEETLQFFVPLAKALNLENAAEELKERSMKVINQKE